MTRPKPNAGTDNDTTAPDTAVEEKAPERAEAQPSDPSSGGRSLVQRQDGRTLRRITIYLPVDLAKRLAVYCAEHDRDMSDVIAEAVRGRLDG